MLLYDKDIDQAYREIIKSLKLFFKKAGMKKAVLGLSGGMDSALVLPLAVKALGPDNCHALLMPSPYSTLHSVTDAVDLANNLGVNYDIIPIDKIYNRFLKAAEPILEDGKWSVTQENLQARIRGTILMAYSNEHNALLLNTSNKSELLMGYGTLYGDLCGAVMVIADLYKTQVYEMARYINRNKTIIPVSTLTKAPSAELREDQKDTDSLPDYSILDPILYALHDKGRSPSKVLREFSSVADAELIRKIIGMRKKNSFKVKQIPPIIKVSEKPVGEYFQ